MTDQSTLLERITARPDVFGGKPIVRDMRISVELILSLMSQGVPQEEILDDYPGLEPDDIRACTAYARAVIAGVGGFGGESGCSGGERGEYVAVALAVNTRSVRWRRSALDMDSSKGKFFSSKMRMAWSKSSSVMKGKPRNRTAPVSLSRCRSNCRFDASQAKASGRLDEP